MLDSVSQLDKLAEAFQQLLSAHVCIGCKQNEKHSVRDETTADLFV